MGVSFALAKHFTKGLTMDKKQHAEIRALAGEIGVPEKLLRMIARRMGLEGLKDRAPHIAELGGDAGWVGFRFPEELLEFHRAAAPEIREVLHLGHDYPKTVEVWAVLRIVAMRITDLANRQVAA